MRFFLLFLLFIQSPGFAGTIYPVGGGVNCATGSAGTYQTDGTSCTFSAAAGTGTLTGPGSSTTGAIATWHDSGAVVLDNQKEILISGSTTTTDATVSTVQTISPSSNTAVLLHTKVVGRRTGGSAGTAVDSAGLIRTAVCKNVAGTASVQNLFNDYTFRDQASWEATITASGATCLIQVNGATNNNVSWTYSTTQVTQ